MKQRALYLFIIPAYSRGSMMFGIKFLRYGRPQGGIGTDFFARKHRIVVLATILVPVILSLWLGPECLWLNGSFAIMTGLILFYYRWRMGCITGDMLGAMVELEEAGLLLIACIGAMP
jgi:adenosylcobinamide-GDP ribazoletransferase